ncbi:MAG: amidohydrolase family protein [Gemmatimonadetes bacterium]|nr:amidohydrolase family protein [Gemmatimonadota bacterium]
MGVLTGLLPLGCQPGDEASQPATGDYDVVILDGRVIDPETGLDSIRNIGIRAGAIEAVTTAAISGTTTIDASGLIVSPGFVDLHAHGQDSENYRTYALGGVTSAFEMEAGTGDVDRWYREREGRALVNYGVSAGHIPARIAVMKDPGAFFPTGDAAHREATDAEVAEIQQRLEDGLRQGAVGLGMGLQYTPAASRWEILEVFRVAARHEASVHVHLRYMGRKEPSSAIAALEEVLAAAAVTGAPLHVLHVHSSGLAATPRLLAMIDAARGRGLDVTTEVYPYTAGMTALQSAIFDEGWQDILGIDYGDLEWPPTGERLTPQSFARYRKTPGWVVIHFIPEEVMEAAVESPLTLIASDGRLENGKGHPRTGGSYARVLGTFAREKSAFSWTEAIRKMALMPAQRLEGRVPAMRRKGRVQVGADADLALFDPETVEDLATYQEPARPPAGFRYILVNGVPVVWEGQLQEGVLPGRGIRAPAGPTGPTGESASGAGEKASGTDGSDG